MWEVKSALDKFTLLQLEELLMSWLRGQVV